MVDRRDWFKQLLPSVVEGTRALREEVVEPDPQRRPPGAVDERTFLELCTRCGDCVTACPHVAIFTYNPGTGAVEGTPVMLPDHRPCHMCEGFPCIQACEPKALLPLETATWKLGEVRIDKDHCFTFRGPECGACRDLCPDGIKAIRFVGTRPQMVEGECIGCGICIDACPTSPKALVLIDLPPAQG